MMIACKDFKARFPLRKILAISKIFLAKNLLLMRTKISPVPCEKISAKKIELSSTFFAFRLRNYDLANQDAADDALPHS